MITYKIQMSFSILLSSANFSGGTDYSNYEYQFNFQNTMEDGEYDLTFSFSADGTTIHDILYVELEGLANFNSYISNSYSSVGFHSNVIGVITPQEKTTSGNYHYSVSSTYNPPLRLKNRPLSNVIKVNIRNTTGALVNINAPYLLQLNFKKI